MPFNYTSMFLYEIFDIPYFTAQQLKIPRNFIQYGLWEEMTEEQFETLYLLAQEGKYGDFFHLAREMNKKRNDKRKNSYYRKRNREDPEYNLKNRLRKKEYRRNKNAMDRKIQTK